MDAYHIFGGCLRSELSFPELPRLEAHPPTWTLVRVREPAPADHLELLGSTRAGRGEARLYRTPDGFRLRYSDTGTFDISANGREIAWAAPPDAPLDAARLDVIGRVLATAMHAAGMLSLHASAVAVGTEAIGFAAPKHYGKSTLAMALVTAGARLLTDDVLAIEPRHPPMARPGPHHVRLWADSADLVRRNGGSTSQRTPRSKHLVRELAPGQLVTDPLPLRALYIMTPVDSREHGEVTTRTPLSGVHAALALVRHARLGDLLGRSEAAALLERAAAVASKIPVYRLELVRDYARLRAVADTILHWHGGAGAAGSGGPVAA